MEQDQDKEVKFPILLDTPSWFTVSLISNIRKKSRFIKTFKHYNSYYRLKEYQRLGSKLKRDTRLAYNVYLNVQETAMVNTSIFWNYVRNRKNTNRL